MLHCAYLLFASLAFLCVCLWFIVVFICIFEIVLCLEFPNCVTAVLLGTNFPISYSPQPPDVPTHLLPVPSSAQLYSFLLLGHSSHLFQPFCLFDFDCFCDAGSLCVQWLSKCCLYSTCSSCESENMLVNWPWGQIRTAGPCTHASNRPRLKETSNRKQCFAFFQSFCKSKNIWDCMKGNKMCWKIHKLVESCQRDQLVYNYTFKNISNTQRYAYRLNEMSNVVFHLFVLKVRI